MVRRRFGFMRSRIIIFSIFIFISLSTDANRFHKPRFAPATLNVTCYDTVLGHLL